MQQNIRTHSHTVTFSVNILPRGCRGGKKKSIEAREGKENKKIKRERESSRHICDEFTAATCSRLIQQTNTHADEPHLQTGSIWEQRKSEGEAAAQQPVIASVTTESTGGALTLRHFDI